MLDDEKFKTIIDSALPVSIDILLKKDAKVLLGNKVNKPTQGYFFRMKPLNMLWQKWLSNELNSRMTLFNQLFQRIV